jgi:hypothetical protein
MKGLYYRFEAIEQFAIRITICLEPLRSLLKHVEEVVGRMTVLKVLSEGLCSKVYACLFGIETQSGKGIESWKRMSLLKT